MEKSDRVKRYRDGVSISEIARQDSVSRQAVIKSLKKAGVHSVVSPGAILIAKESSKPVVSCPIDLDRVPDAVEARCLLGGSREKRIGRNLYFSDRGYVVRYWEDGLVEKVFITKGDLLAAYT